MLIFIVLTTSHHYLTQLDMSIIVIEKIMIQRQQTQLQSFFNRTLDSVIVASEDTSKETGHRNLNVELCNPSFLKILGVEIYESLEFNTL